MTWPFHSRLNHKMLTSKVDVVALEIWGKNLEAIWAVNCDSVYGVFNIHNFLKFNSWLYLVVGCK